MDSFVSKPLFAGAVPDEFKNALRKRWITHACRKVSPEDCHILPAEDVQRSLQAGLNAHLSKPVEPDSLFETLESLIRN